MASTYTDSLGLEKQGDGENANTWGLRLNESVIDLVDEAVAGYIAVALSSGVQTTITNTDGSSSTGRHATLEFTGAISTVTTVTIPTQQKQYAVINRTSATGGDILVKNAGQAANTGQTIKAGKSALLVTNGSQVKKIGDSEEFESGTRMAFAQAAAPTGWTVETSTIYNNSALRIITAATSGTGGGSGGTISFNNAFNTAIQVTVAGDTVNATLTGNVSATVLTEAQIPAHRHLMFANTTVGNSGGQSTATTQVPVERGGAGASSEDHKYAMGTTGTEATLGRTSSIGSGSSHTHSIAGLGSHNHAVSITGTFNLNPRYVNFIVCTKD